MSDMVFCRGCGASIHISATACPKCGAPGQGQQGQQVSGSAGADGFFDLGIMPLKKFATFEGRARRKEYWFFVLLCMLINFVIGFIGGIAGSTFIVGISTLFTLATIVPSIAVGVRRMHDTDRSGWWILLPIVNLVFLCLPGQQGPNRFGADPKN